MEERILNIKYSRKERLFRRRSNSYSANKRLLVEAQEEYKNNYL
jgi:hypothetical protein